MICHLTKKSNEIIYNDISVQFKKDGVGQLAFDEKINSQLSLLSIHRRRIYDVHRILSTSKIQRVSKTLGTYLLTFKFVLILLKMKEKNTLKSLISMEFFLFFLRKNSQLHALLESPRLFIFGEKSHLHDY